MLSTASDSELVNACRTLFSPFGSKCSIDFVKSLNSSALNKAYRKKAFETHPDRCNVLGVDKSELDERFRKIKTAYEVLKPVAQGQRRMNNSQFKEGFYSGPLPLHTLRMGQYLYYTGTISWQTLMEAIAWQRRKTPLYGLIARTWGMLSQEDVLSIMTRKKIDEKIGEYAVRMGYLTTFQHLAILGKQRKSKTLFGAYFVSKGLYSERQMELAAQQASQHNETILNGLS